MRTNATPAPESKPLVDRWLHRIKDRPLVAVIILASIVIVGLGQTTDALVKLRGLFWSPPSVAGQWKYKMRSSVSGATINGVLDLMVSGDLVSGEMDNPDPQKPGERSSLQGTVVGDSLTLRRTTNRNGVVQEYRLSRTGKELVGTFSNLGQLPGTYFADKGDIRLTR